MLKLTKVSMSLTETDMSNAEKLQGCLHVKNKADVVSAALAITRALSVRLARGEQLLIRTRGGRTERVMIPGFDE